MATSPSALNVACYEAESSYGETGSTAATLLLALAAPVDTSGLTQSLIDPTPAKQRLMDGVKWIPGPQGGTFKTKLWLTGHGSSCSGSVSIGLHETLIANHVLGSGSGAAVSSASGTTLTGGTAAAWTTTASGTFTAGSLCRLGALNDAKGNGQFYAVGTHTTNTLTPLTQPAGVGASDVLYSAVTGYLPSTTTTQRSARFLLQSKGLQYLCHGCVPTAVAWAGLNAGEVPSVEITWSTAWWEYSTATFPSSATTEVFTPAPCAAGSLWINTVGTATSAYRTVRNFTIEHTLGTILIDGQGGVNAYQKTVGVVRGPDTVKVSWVEDADSTTLTPVLPGYATGGNAKHVLYTCNTVDGKAMGFYFPNLVISDAVPVQYNDNGVNRLKITAMAYTGPVTTSELTSSAMRVGWA